MIVSIWRKIFTNIREKMNYSQLCVLIYFKNSALSSWYLWIFYFRLRPTQDKCVFCVFYPATSVNLKLDYCLMEFLKFQFGTQTGCIRALFHNEESFSRVPKMETCQGYFWRKTYSCAKVWSQRKTCQGSSSIAYTSKCTLTRITCQGSLVFHMHTS